VHLNLKPKQR